MLGHSASWRKKPTPEGYTHDWTVLVRGEEGQDIRHFVEKVVFLLHESFPKPKRGTTLFCCQYLYLVVMVSDGQLFVRPRIDVLFPFLVVKDPPFQVAESGYGSFMLPVEVYFRNKDEPKKVRFEYDLLLPNLNDPPINQIRSECLTFQNPSEEFRQKLLKAGGSISGGPPPALPPTEKKQAPLPPVIKPPKRSAPGVGLDSDSTKKKKKLEKSKGEKKKKKVGSSSSDSSDSDTSSDSESGMDETPAKRGKTISPNTWDTGALKKLHKQLNSLQDPQQLQEIVNIIEQTALYTLTASTFDFDLCKLDDTTLTKLVKFIEPTG